MFDAFDIDAIRTFLAPFVRGLARNGDPLTLVALGLGSVAALARVRLLTFACLAAGVAGLWMLLQGMSYIEAPWPLAAGVALLLIAGIVEAVVVAVGGREAAPTFWATVLVGLIAFLVLGPLRAGLRVGGAAAGIGGLAGRVLSLFRRGGRHG